MKKSDMVKEVEGDEGSSLPKGCIYEVSFGYPPKMDVYTTLTSDISKLGESLSEGKADE